MLEKLVSMFVLFSMFVLVRAHTFCYLLSWDNIVKYFLKINITQGCYRCTIVKKKARRHVFKKGEHS